MECQFQKTGIEDTAVREGHGSLANAESLLVKCMTPHL